MSALAQSAVAMSANAVAPAKVQTNTSTSAGLLLTQGTEILSGRTRKNFCG